MLVADPYLQQTFSFNLIEYFNLNVYPTPPYEHQEIYVKTG